MNCDLEMFLSLWQVQVSEADTSWATLIASAIQKYHLMLAHARSPFLDRKQKKNKVTHVIVVSPIT